MKVMFDTNIYVRWIREQKHGDLLLKLGTVKYLSSIVLMELWAGAKTKRASRLVETLQKPYLNTGRVIPLTLRGYIVVGQIISGLPASYKHTRKLANFLNDIQIALTALSVGATLYTNNRSHFKLINKFLRQLKVLYV